MDDPFPRLPILAALVLLSGFFSLGSFAISRSRKSRLRLKAAESPVIEAADKPGPYIFAMRLWNLMLRLGTGYLAWYFYSRHFAAISGDRPAPEWIPLVILILGFIVVSEIIPSVIASGRPESVLLFIFPVVSALSLPWTPLYRLASRVPRPRDNTDPEEAGDEEFRIALEEGEKSGAVESRERSMVEGVLYLGDRPVSAFMTHRSEIQWLDINATAEEAWDKVMQFRSQGFFPVVKETQDNIAGVASVQEILIALTEMNGGSPWKGLPAIMQPPYFIPETMSALKAFEAFQREEEYFLCVMDEYGGFAGALRVRNLLDEIVGELTGQDAEEEAVARLPDGSYLAAGSVSADELAEVLGIDSLGDGAGGFHTLAGFILKLAGDIPKTGDSFSWGGFRFRVVDKDGNRIDKVEIRKE